MKIDCISHNQCFGARVPADFVQKISKNCVNVSKEQATVFAEHLARIADDTVLIKDITTKFKKAHFLGKSNAFIKIEAEKQLPDGNTLKNTYGDLEVRKTPFSLQEILDRVVPFLRRSNYM